MADIYYKLDKKTRDDLVETFKRVAVEILEGPKETWLTGDEVSKMWPFFSKDWISKYGYLLPRKHIVTIDKDGPTNGRWYYTQNYVTREFNGTPYSRATRLEAEQQALARRAGARRLGGAEVGHDDVGGLRRTLRRRKEPEVPAIAYRRADGRL